MTLFEKYNENGRFNYNAVIKNVCIGDCELLDGHYDVEASKSICSKIGIIEEKCKKCWNLNYIENPVADINIRVGTKWREKKTKAILTITSLDKNQIWFNCLSCTDRLITIGSMARENFTNEKYEYIEDNINHPEHYQGKHECIDIMRVMFGDEAVKSFCKCNAFKYRFRAGRKEGNSAEQDINKAEWYEEYLFEMEKEDKHD